MDQRLVPKSVIFLLLAGGVVLPVAVCVCLGVSGLLAAMGDTIGSAVLHYVAWGCGAVWVVDLISLILAAGINSLGEKGPPSKE